MIFKNVSQNTLRDIIDQCVKCVECVMENFPNYFLSNRTNFELKIIEFFEIFLPFRINRIVNFRIESNEFRTNSNLTPPLCQGQNDENQTKIENTTSLH